MIEIFEWDLRDENPNEYIHQYLVFQDKICTHTVGYSDQKLIEKIEYVDKYEDIIENEFWIKTSITFNELKARYL